MGLPSRTAAALLTSLLCTSTAQLTDYVKGSVKTDGTRTMHSYWDYHLDDPQVTINQMAQQMLRTDRYSADVPKPRHGSDWVFNKRWVDRYARVGGSYPETAYEAGPGKWLPLDEPCNTSLWADGMQAVKKQLGFDRHICQVNLVESLARMHGPLQEAYRKEIMCSKPYGCNSMMNQMRIAWLYSKCNCTQVNNCFDTRSTFMCDILGDCRTDYAWDAVCSARSLAVSLLTWIALLAVTYWNAVAMA